MKKKDIEKLADVTVTAAEINGMIAMADAAIDGDSNDAEYDALVAIRNQLMDIRGCSLERRKHNES